MGMTCMGGSCNGVDYSTMVDNFEKFRHKTEHALGENGCWYETGIVDKEGATTFPGAILVFDENDGLVCAKRCDGVEDLSSADLRKAANGLYADYEKSLASDGAGSSRRLPSLDMDVSDSMEQSIC